MHFSSQTEQLSEAQTDVGALMRVAAQLDFPMHYDEQKAFVSGNSVLGLLGSKGTVCGVQIVLGNKS